MKKIIIAFDSFKGCLSSQEANTSAANAICHTTRDVTVRTIPIADGGEGWVDALLAATQGTRMTAAAHDPLMRPIQCHYGISREKDTAFIELAAASGLTRLKNNERKVWTTTSYGTGELIADALKKGCRNFIIGIGGSATNDGGLGLLQALGFVFRDLNGQPISTPIRGCDLQNIQGIDSSHVNEALKEAHFEVACDVTSPLCGPEGAAYVFAPQKGADQKTIEFLDRGLAHLGALLESYTSRQIINHPGAGAAGGAGGGLLALLDAELKPGIELILDQVHFADELKDTDLIITGEGSADRQTSMGKVAAGILKKAQQHAIPVALLAGQINDEEELHKAGYSHILCINPHPISLEEAMRPEVAETNIQYTVTELMNRLMHS